MDLFGEFQRMERFFVKPGSRASQDPTLRSREIDQINVLVTGRDLGELYPSRAAELERLTGHVDLVQRLTEQRGDNAGLLEDLSHCGFIRKLIRLDVPTRRQPAAKLLVIMKEDMSIPADENGHGEITRQPQTVARHTQRPSASCGEPG